MHRHQIDCECLYFERCLNIDFLTDHLSDILCLIQVYYTYLYLTTLVQVYTVCTGDCAGWLYEQVIELVFVCSMF